MTVGYEEFVAIASRRGLQVQYSRIESAAEAYAMWATDGALTYRCETDDPADVADFNAVVKPKANATVLTHSSFGLPIVAPSFDDVQGLYPKKKSHRGVAAAGMINFFDVEVLNERRINGGEYWVHPDDVAGVHDDDYVEFSIIDKNDVLGLFPAFGLSAANGDILELVKFVVTDYVKKGDPANGYHSQLFEGIKGTNAVMPGLFMRVAYDSYGASDLRITWRVYYYE